MATKKNKVKFNAQLDRVYGTCGLPRQRVLEAYGDELMYAGIPVDRQYLTDKGGDFAALLFLLKEVE